MFRLSGRKERIFRKLCASFIILFFACSTVLDSNFVYAQISLNSPALLLNLPSPGVFVNTTQSYTPALIKGLSIHPENPLELDFIIDSGQSGLQGNNLKTEANVMIKYFLASLTVPEDETWVNLSPYEKDRIIPNAFGQTEMGRDLLSQDYLLKQLTASLLYPEKELGKEFWDRVYKKTQGLYGTTEIPVNTFNKVWVVPEKAIVFEYENSVFVVESHLKVMLEDDYFALANAKTEGGTQTHVRQDSNNAASSQIIRDIIIPEIEKELNEGKAFAKLRQIYHAMILATWYKINLEQSLLGQIYVDQNKIKGIDLEDKESKEKIYNQYLAAFKQGVYNYIREDYDLTTKKMVARKYFSGGFSAAEGVSKSLNGQDSAQLSMGFGKGLKGMVRTDRIKGVEALKSAGYFLKGVTAPIGKFMYNVKVSLIENLPKDAVQDSSNNRFFKFNSRMLILMGALMSGSLPAVASVAVQSEILTGESSAVVLATEEESVIVENKEFPDLNKYISEKFRVVYSLAGVSSDEMVGYIYRLLEDALLEKAESDDGVIVVKETLMKTFPMLAILSESGSDKIELLVIFSGSNISIDEVKGLNQGDSPTSQTMQLQELEFVEDDVSAFSHTILVENPEESRFATNVKIENIRILLESVIRDMEIDPYVLETQGLLKEVDSIFIPLAKKAYDSSVVNPTEILNDTSEENIELVDVFEETNRLKNNYMLQLMIIDPDEAFDILQLRNVSPSNVGNLPAIETLLKVSPQVVVNFLDTVGEAKPDRVVVLINKVQDLIPFYRDLTNIENGFDWATKAWHAKVKESEEFGGKIRFLAADAAVEAEEAKGVKLALEARLVDRISDEERNSIITLLKVEEEKIKKANELANYDGLASQKDLIRKMLESNVDGITISNFLSYVSNDNNYSWVKPYIEELLEEIRTTFLDSAIEEDLIPFYLGRDTVSRDEMEVATIILEIIEEEARTVETLRALDPNSHASFNTSKKYKNDFMNYLRERVLILSEEQLNTFLEHFRIKGYSDLADKLLEGRKGQVRTNNLKSSDVVRSAEVNSSRFVMIDSLVNVEKIDMITESAPKGDISEESLTVEVSPKVTASVVKDSIKTYILLSVPVLVLASLGMNFPPIELSIKLTNGIRRRLKQNKDTAKPSQKPLPDDNKTFIPGGINLDRKLLDLQIKRNDEGMVLPIWQQPLEQMRIDGFFPIIMNITPIHNVPMYLGLVDSDNDSEIGLNSGLDPIEQKSRLEVLDLKKLSYLN